MKESAWTAKVCRELEMMNAVILPIVAQTKMPPGWPDRYIHHRYWQGFVEFKGETTVLAKHQEQRIGQLNERAPGSAFIARLLPGSKGSQWSGCITTVRSPNGGESEILGHFTDGRSLVSELSRLTAEVRRPTDVGG